MVGGRPRGVLVAAAISTVLILATWRATATPHRRPLVPKRSGAAGARSRQSQSSPDRDAQGPTAAWVVKENARPGTADWRIADAGLRGQIEGFADRVSSRQGDPVTLYVSSEAPGYVVESYRMGWYGGLGGRLVWRSAPLVASKQPDPVRDRETNMVDTAWEASVHLRPDASWPPGDYLLKLVADTGAQSYVPLTLRDDASTAAYVVQNSVTTWQAYNLWGGYDLYEGRNGSRSDFEHRSRVVSFDRPYAFGDGAADFLGNELPLVSLVESLGLNVTYRTDIDLHQRPEELQRHRALLSLGHDEYWTAAMREGAELARNHGTNLAFLGANAVFRQIRLAESDLGPDRHEIGYKRAREDPLYGVDNAHVSVDWRAAPVSNPESSLVGDYYECNPVKADMAIADATAWVFDGTGLADGDRLPDLVGPEYDRYDPDVPGPGNVQVLAHSPVRCHGKASFSDMIYYTDPGGAGVFATGTNWWVSRLNPACNEPECRRDDRAVRITENVLKAFGAGPAGLGHPSRPNSETVLKATTSPSGVRSLATTTTVSSPRTRTTRQPPRFPSAPSSVTQPVSEEG